MTIENEKGERYIFAHDALLSQATKQWVSESERINPEAVAIITSQSVQEALA